MNSSRHLLRESFHRDDFERIVAGYDQGAAHPGVFTVWGWSGKLGFVELETVTRSRTQIVSKAGDGWVDIAMSAWQRWRYERIYYPTDAFEASSQFHSEGLPVAPAHQGPGSRLAGLQWFMTGLHNDEVRLTTPLVYHRFSGLRHPENRAGREAELWVKEDDDEFDASRYALSEWIQSGRLASTRRLTLVGKDLFSR
jgi:hypothetical protein